MKPNRDSGFLLHRGTLGLVRLGQSQRNNQYCYQVIFKFLCQKSCELFVIPVIVKNKGQIAANPGNTDSLTLQFMITVL